MGVRAEHLAQRGVHEVRAGVRLRGAATVLLRRRRVVAASPTPTSPERDLHGVADEALDGLLHVEHLELEAVADDAALVGRLAAGLRVERGLGEDDLGGLARRRDGHGLRRRRGGRARVDSVVRSV